MRLAVISDTHMEAPSSWFRRFFERHLLEADVLIHCGDITGPAMLEYMEQSHPNFHAVAGNCCDWRVAQELPALLKLSLGGHMVGVTHGWGDRASLPGRLPDAFGPGFGLILFGHLHRQMELRFGDTLVVNPGCLCAETPRMAYVELGERISVEFVRNP